MAPKAVKLLKQLEKTGVIRTQVYFQDDQARDIIEAFGQSAHHKLPAFIRQILEDYLSKSKTVAGRQSLNGLAVAAGQSATVSSNED